MIAKKSVRIGFVGQGYVGGSYANNFEKRGFSVVRYSLEERYRANKEKIRECDVVFVCVPTPTTPKGFDVSIVEESLALIGKGKIAVIKSTLAPGTTRFLQKKFSHISVLCSPEFLSVATAQLDADSPFSNIVGMPDDDQRHRKAAKLVQSILPTASFSLTCTSEEAELIKYAHNFSGYTQIIAFNIMYDLAQHLGADWEQIEKAIHADPLVPNRYAHPVHKGGRGAGGACFIKDVASLSRLYASMVKHPEGKAYLEALQKKNIALLMASKKDFELLRGVYGDKVVESAMRTRRKKPRKQR